MTDLTTAPEASAKLAEALAKIEAKGKVPFAGKEKRVARVLPSDKPRDENFELIDDPKKAGIPVVLQVHNRQPLTPEQQAEVEASMAKARQTSTDAHQDDLRAAQRKAKSERQRARRAAKKEKREHEAAGKTVAMPVSGKDAAKVIKAERRKKPVPMIVDPEPPVPAVKKPRHRAVKGFEKSSSKLAVIKRLAERENGCTTADVLEATGWKAVNMPREIQKAGLKLRTEKKPGEPTRYFGS